MPTGPRSRKCPTHLAIVLALTPNDLAASAWLASPVMTCLAISLWRKDAKRVFLCISIQFHIEAFGQASWHDNANLPNPDHQYNLMADHNLRCINKLSLSIRRQLMGGFDPRSACGRCQLHLWVHAGKSVARSSDVS